MFISILTGFIAGAIHVVGGADHLVAMAPNAMRSPKFALREGLSWGVGHSTGVLCLSFLAVLAKDLININKVSSLAEFIVGITLLVVGAFAIRTAFGLNIHMHNHKHCTGEDHQHVHLHWLGRKVHNPHSHTSTGLGILHGLAGASHLIAVIPALALPTMGAIAYMFAYLLGSIVAMGSVVLGISVTTMKAGRRVSPLIMGFAGGLSIATGFFWIQKNPLLS